MASTSAKQREQVDREPEDQQDQERADQADRDDGGGNERRAPRSEEEDR